VAQTKSLPIEPQLKTKPQIKIVYLQGKTKTKTTKTKTTKNLKKFSELSLGRQEKIVRSCKSFLEQQSRGDLKLLLLSLLKKIFGKEIPSIELLQNNIKKSSNILSKTNHRLSNTMICSILTLISTKKERKK